MPRRMRGTTPEVEAAARQLRRGMTPTERVLWAALRDRQLAGLKFRRQHAVGPFVLDFFCPASRLVVELDGGVHDGQVEQDRARTEHLAGYGYRVLRFRNEEVLGDLDAVLERIAAAGLPEARVHGEVGGVASDALDQEGTRLPSSGEEGELSAGGGGEGDHRPGYVMLTRCNA